MVMTKTNRQKLVCFILVRVNPLPMPCLSPALLHSNLAIHQSLLGTILLIGTCMLVKDHGLCVQNVQC